MSKAAADGLKQRIDVIEGAYEFMLAYAAQGLAGDEGSGSIREVREHLEGSDQALEGLGDLLRTEVKTKKMSPAEPYHAFVETLEGDAKKSRTAIRLVLAQPVIGSQLIDNLNANTHLRALLTDLFLLDEILQPGGANGAD